MKGEPGHGHAYIPELSVDPGCIGAPAAQLAPNNASHASLEPGWLNRHSETLSLCLSLPRQCWQCWSMPGCKLELPQATNLAAGARGLGKTFHMIPEHRGAAIALATLACWDFAQDTNCQRLHQNRCGFPRIGAGATLHFLFLPVPLVPCMSLKLSDEYLGTKAAITAIRIFISLTIQMLLTKQQASHQPPKPPPRC